MGENREHIKREINNLIVDLAEWGKIKNEIKEIDPNHEGLEVADDAMRHLVERVQALYAKLDELSN